MDEIRETPKDDIMKIDAPQRNTRRLPNLSASLPIGMMHIVEAMRNTSITHPKWDSVTSYVRPISGRAKFKALLVKGLIKETIMTIAKMRFSYER